MSPPAALGTPIVSLRPYQRDTLEAITAARLAGSNRLLVKSPTGTGKTVCFSAMPTWPGLKTWLDTFPAAERRMLVIAHREELLDQAVDKIQRANPKLMVSVEQGDRHANRYSDVVVASIQTLSSMKFRRLERLLQWHRFRLVIVDEAHHAAAATYRGALSRLGFLPKETALPDSSDDVTEADAKKLEAALADWDRIAPQDRLLVGVTATPNRSDAIGLGCVFQTIAYSYALKDAISDGWLVPLTPWVVETTESLDDVKLVHGDFNQRQLANAVNTRARNQLAVKAWQQYGAGRSTLAFTVDVQHAHDLAKAFLAAGVAAAPVSGETPREERRDILRRFQAAELEVITNCMVLTEGTDLPRASCILHAKPTKSPTLYEQMTGRGLRLFDGKADCVVIDLVDVARRHSLMAAPVLYGLPPALKAQGKKLHELAPIIDEFREKLDLDSMTEPYTLEDLRLRAERVDVWAVPELGEVGAGLTMNWIKTGSEVFRLQYPWSDGIEILVVEKDLLGHFGVSCTLKPQDGGAVRQRTIAAQIPEAQPALKLAEAFVLQERRSVMKLKDREAPWREGPATDKQMALLRRLRVPIRPGLTKGGASDLIDLAQSRRAR